MSDNTERPTADEVNALPQECTDFVHFMAYCCGHKKMPEWLSVMQRVIAAQLAGVKYDPPQQMFRGRTVDEIDAADSSS